MLNWFKQQAIKLLDLDTLEKRVSEMEDEALTDIIGEKAKAFSIEAFIRNKLGSINLDDVRNIVRKDDELKAYQDAIAAVFKEHIEPTIKKMIIAQEEFMARSSSDMNQFNIGRGTINGLFLLLEEFEAAYNANAASSTKPEKPDQTTIFSTIPTIESLTIPQ